MASFDQGPSEYQKSMRFTASTQTSISFKVPAPKKYQKLVLLQYLSENVSNEHWFYKITSPGNCATGLGHGFGICNGGARTA